ncbi:MAG: CoA-binding protein [Candidatus Geothermincolales bacterium]
MVFERDFERLFNPRSIAVVGASNQPGKWGFLLPMNIIGGGYRGKLYMVNPGEKRVLGLPAYPSLEEVPGPLDLVVVAIPARKVPEIVGQAAEKGVKNMLVVSSNFSEVGGEGVELERRVAEMANEAGITIVGPNTMGLYSSTSRLLCIGAPVRPLPGKVGFVSQSGNLGVQMLTWGRRKGLGFSRFVGCGNSANTDVTDYLEYLGKDPETEVILLYVEGVKDGRRFLEVAAEITPRKPVIVLKTGKGEQGKRAVLSHSGAMAGPYELFHGAMRQSGILEVETTEEMLDLAMAFSSMPVPPGARVAVLTLGGGWGVVATDALEKEGLQMAVLPEELIEELDPHLPVFWSRKNPVDLVGNAHRSSHFIALEALAKCGEVDLLVAMGMMFGANYWLEDVLSTSVRPFMRMLRRGPGALIRYQLSIGRGARRSVKGKGQRSREGSGGVNLLEAWKWSDRAMTRKILSLMRETGKPIIPVAVNESELSTALRFRRARLFTAMTPERAARVAGHMVRYSSFLRKRAGENPGE